MSVTSAKPKIAVLDDDKHWCFVLERILRSEFEVTTFQRISPFLRDIDAIAQYDLLIVDFSIPPARYEKDMNGCDLIQYLKQTLPHPPFMLLATAFLGKNDLAIASDLCPGADGFLVKDAGLEVIVKQIKQLLMTKLDFSS